MNTNIVNTAKVNRQLVLVWLLLVAAVVVNALFNTLIFCVPLFLTIVVLCVRTLFSKKDVYSICMFSFLILVSLAVIYDILSRNLHILPI